MTLNLFPSTTKHDLTHPISGEATGLILEMLPSDHDTVYEAGVEVVKSLRSKGVQSAIDVAVSLENRIKVAAAAIVGWEVKSEQWEAVFKELGFTDAVFSREKAIALLSLKTASWIRSQVEAIMSNKEAFFKQVSNS
jgi:hypothetical protein